MYFTKKIIQVSKNIYKILSNKNIQMVILTILVVPAFPKKLLTWIPSVRSCWDFEGRSSVFCCFHNFWRRSWRWLPAAGSTWRCSALDWPAAVDLALLSCPKWRLYCSARCSCSLDHRHLSLSRHWNKERRNCLFLSSADLSAFDKFLNERSRN